MLYSDTFIKKCMQVYPDWEDLQILLKKQSKMVGRLLEDAVGFSLDEDQIISLFRNKKEHKILEAAKRAQVKRELYQEWISIIDNQAESNAKALDYEL